MRLLLKLGAVIALLFPAAPAIAGGPAISLSAKAQHPEARVAIHGASFDAVERVDVAFDDTPVANATTDERGAFVGAFRIPTSASPGDHLVAAVGEESGLRAEATFRVSTNWRGFHFDLRNRYNPYENVLDASNVANLVEKWSFATNGTILSSPAVVDGVAYVGSNDGSVYALDASTGEQLWSYLTGGAVRSSPTVAKGVVYVGSQAAKLLALDASTGEKVWETQMIGAVNSSPTVWKGVVYVGSTDSGGLFAFDATSGEMLWSFDQPVSTSPAVAGGGIFVGTTWPYDWVFRFNTLGDREWDYLLPSSSPSSPMVVNGVVYFTVTDLGAMYALDATTGLTVWRCNCSYGYTADAPAVARGLAYMDSWEGHVTAIDVAEGTTAWDSRVEDYGDMTAPAVANGVVYVGSENHHLIALLASSGTMLLSLDTGAAVGSSPAVVNGMVYVGSGTSLKAFGLPDGQG